MTELRYNYSLFSQTNLWWRKALPHLEYPTTLPIDFLKNKETEDEDNDPTVHVDEVRSDSPVSDTVREEKDDKTLPKMLELGHSNDDKQSQGDYVGESENEEIEEPQQILENVPLHVDEPQPILENVPLQVEEPQPILENAPLHVDEPQSILENAPLHVEEPQPILENAPLHVEEPQSILENTPLLIEEPQSILENAPLHVEEPPLILENVPLLINEPQPILENGLLHVEEPQPIRENVPLHENQPDLFDDSGVGSETEGNSTRNLSISQDEEESEDEDTNDEDYMPSFSDDDEDEDIKGYLDMIESITEVILDEPPVKLKKIDEKLNVASDEPPVKKKKVEEVKSVSEAKVETKMVEEEKSGSFSESKHKDGRKMHHCLYCKKWFYRIPRHMITKHDSQPEVAKIMKMPKKEKDDEFAKLRKQGDFEANIESAKNSSEYTTVVRESKNLNIVNYSPCIHCFGMFNTKTLTRHMHACKAKPTDQKDSGNVKASKMLLQRHLSKESKFAELREHVFSRMAEGEVSNLIKNDNGLTLYAYYMFEKSGPSAFSEISHKLRSMARLLIEYRKCKDDPNVESLDLIDPGKWDSVIDSVKSLVSHKGDEKVGVPSLLLTLGRSIEALGCTKRAIGIKSKDKEMVENSRDFLELHSQYWKIYAKHALSTLQSKKDKKPELLPFTADLKALRSYLVKELEICFKEAAFSREKGTVFAKWNWLANIVVARLICFNARRGGEVSKLTIDDWEQCDQWKRKEDIENLENEVEKKLAERMKVVYVKGKRKRRVPILFTKEDQDAVEILLEFRSDAGVSSQNEFVFARSTRNAQTAIRGWDALHRVSMKAGLKKPELVTSTKIRKHLATVFQLLNMTDGELNWVTDHLGHTADVHKKWYRLEESTVEVTKMAQLLVARDQGKSFKNKKIHEVLGDDEVLLAKKTAEEESHNVPSIPNEDEEEVKVASSEQNSPTEVKRSRWRLEEFAAVKSYFASNIISGTAPTNDMAKACLEKYSCLRTRTPKSILLKVKNLSKK